MSVSANTNTVFGSDTSGPCGSGRSEATPKLKAANENVESTSSGAQISQEAKGRRTGERSIAQPSPEYCLTRRVGHQLSSCADPAEPGLGYFLPIRWPFCAATHRVLFVINPLVGLAYNSPDGATYFKMRLGMVLINSDRKSYRRHPVAIVTRAVCAAFHSNLPRGLLMAQRLFQLLIACLLGLSLYKCADRWH